MTELPAEQLAAYLKANLAPSDRILIVGGRSTNFPIELRSNPRLTFWDSIDPKTYRHSKIPAGVRVIILTRFIKHKLVRRLDAILPPHVMLVKYWQGTGRIKDILEAAGIVVGAVEVSPAAEMARKPIKYSELAYLLKQKARFDILPKEFDAEIHRLREELLQAGFEVATALVAKCFHRLRRKWEEKHLEASVVKPIGEVIHVVESEAEAAAPETKEEPAEPAYEPLAHHVHESVQHLWELIGFLKQVGNKAELAAVAIAELIADRERLLKIEEEHCEFKKTLNDFIKENIVG